MSQTAMDDLRALIPKLTHFRVRIVRPEQEHPIEPCRPECEACKIKRIADRLEAEMALMRKALTQIENYPVIDYNGPVIRAIARAALAQAEGKETDKK